MLPFDVGLRAQALTAGSAGGALVKAAALRQSPCRLYVACTPQLPDPSDSIRPFDSRVT